MWVASIQPKILEISVGTSNGTDHFDLVRPEYLGPSCGPLLPVWLVRPQCPFPFDKSVVPSTALLYPVCPSNNQMHDGLGQVCATEMYHSIGYVEFPKFQTGILKFC